MSIRTTYAASTHTGESLNLPATLTWKRARPTVSRSRTEILRDVLNPLLDDLLQRFSDLEPTSPIAYRPGHFIVTYSRASGIYDLSSCVAETGGVSEFEENYGIRVPGFDDGAANSCGSCMPSPAYCLLGRPSDHLASEALTGESLVDARFGGEGVVGFRPVSPSAVRDSETTDHEWDSASDADPVGVVARIGTVLGVTQHDVLHGTGIAERTYYDWKANRRQPRLASLGSLWALDQATTDIVRVLADPAAWMRSNIQLRVTLQDGRFDDLVVAALEFARSRSELTPERAAAQVRQQTGTIAADNAVLDIPAYRRAPRRAPITPRRPRRQTGNDEV